MTSAKRVKGPGYFTDPETADRIRGAFIHVRPHEPELLSVGDFIFDAVMRRVEETERAYNHGQPWPGVPAGQAGRGRPPGRGNVPSDQ